MVRTVIVLSAVLWLTAVAAPLEAAIDPLIIKSLWSIISAVRAEVSADRGALERIEANQLASVTAEAEGVIISLREMESAGQWDRREAARESIVALNQCIVKVYLTGLGLLDSVEGAGWTERNFQSARLAKRLNIGANLGAMYQRLSIVKQDSLRQLNNLDALNSHRGFYIREGRIYRSKLEKAARALYGNGSPCPASFLFGSNSSDANVKKVLEESLTFLSSSYKNLPTLEKQSYLYWYANAFAEKSCSGQLGVSARILEWYEPVSGALPLRERLPFVLSAIRVVTRQESEAVCIRQGGWTCEEYGTAERTVFDHIEIDFKRIPDRLKHLAMPKIQRPTPRSTGRPTH